MSETVKPEQTPVNASGTKSRSDTPLTRGRSGPVRYEVVGYNGVVSPMKFDTAQAAATQARKWFPEQEQDADRTGKGWDVQVVGCDQP